MNLNDGAKLSTSSISSGGFTPSSPLPTKQLTINKVENGFIITCGARSYVDHDWLDAVKRIEAFLGIVK